jgi:hypothetical protein
MDGDGEGFGENRHFVFYAIRNRPDIVCRNLDQFCKHSVRIHTKPDFGGANIFMPGPAQLATTAGKIWLNGNPLPHLQTGYPFTDLFNPADGLMARNNGQWNAESAMIERMVRSANTGQQNPYKDFSGPGLGGFGIPYDYFPGFNQQGRFHSASIILYSRLPLTKAEHVRIKRAIFEK